MDTNLKATNAKIEGLLNQIEQTPAESEQSDELVSLLLDSIRNRQNYINSLIDDANDDSYATLLSKQLKLTTEFVDKASKIRFHRQSLLSLKHKNNQRQIKVYQNIDANR